ncbi:hypothetical protein PENTCL1PPCAC_8373 [Pristionchus entomophagus]|uniref:DUF753 domain-containing protein n=1 Tax=Pristionchus entomophagus TaxID=358040 RepID=A0AAV5SVX4_9BILA|nr:hypothetical protein PENTCL1PPCAC_8373 [Pristionchus entomophagus]
MSPNMIAVIVLFATLLGSVEPTVSCYTCNERNANDCTGPISQCNYCTYVRTPYDVTRACAISSFLFFPDNSMTTTINQCERKRINGQEYAVEVCNSGSFCDTHCNSASPPANGQIVSCTTCHASNVNDCTGPTCQGNYCTYVRTPYDVTRSCSVSSFVVYPDQSVTATLNQCERKTINGQEYAMEVCNSGSFCDTQCNSVSLLSTVFSFLLLPVMYLIKC